MDSKQVITQLSVSDTFSVNTVVLCSTRDRRGHWDFWFCGFGYFLDRFFGLCAKKVRFFGFGVHCGLRIFRFLAFGFRFSRKILTGFRI